MSSTNLKISTANLQSLLSGTNLNNVIITNSEIDTTIIGANGASDAFFEKLTALGDVLFESSDQVHSVNWNAATGILSVNADMAVTGCMTIGNLQVCKNDISAINNNGNVNIIPQGIGSINLVGPVSNIVNSRGNYLTQLANGSVTFIASSSVSINSLSAGSSITTFNTQNYTTKNGNINLTTDTGFYTNGTQQSKLITNSDVDKNGIIITTSTPSEVNVGDTVILTNTNSIPNIDATYLVTRIVNPNNFNISTGSNFPGISSIGTYGSLLKIANNSINLSASYSVNIPSNIPLVFGNTTASFSKDTYGNLLTTTSKGSINSITGTTSGMVINSQNNITFNVPSTQISNSNYSVILPQATHLQFGTSGNNFINYDIERNYLYDTNTNSSNANWNTDTAATLAVNSNNNIALNGGNDLYLNIPHTYVQDQNPLIGNYQQTYSDQTDRGIQFNYWSGSQTGGSSRLGWFGYKKSSGNFTFYENAVNTNDIITGTLSKFEIGNINVNTISLSGTSPLFDVNCGQLLNVKYIFGCAGVLNINSTSAINTSTSNLNLNLSTAMNLPNNIPINLGTVGTYIKEGTLGNLWLTSSKNILLNTQTNGSVVIQPNTKISFDGTSIASTSIYQGTSGNLRLDSNQNIFLTVTAGNIIIPPSTSSKTSSIQFGLSSETIYGSTNGIFVNSTSTNGNINLLATSNINISNSIGNILLNGLNGDINLFTTQGNVRLYQSSRVVFGISGTSNSIRQNSIGNLMLYGPGIVPSIGTMGNTIELKNTSQIYLNATNAINTNTGVQFNFSSNNDRYLVTDTIGNFNMINNNFSSGSTINLRSNNTNIINTGGNTNILNNNTNILSNNTNISSGTTLNIITPNTFFNTNYFYLKDQVPLIANYLQTPTDQTDRGIQFNYYNTTKGNADLGWFGIKKNSMEFTYYQSAINTNDVIIGTLGTFNLGSINVSNNILFLTTGNIDMTCGTISNINTLIGCKGVINILASSNITVTSQNLLLNTGLVQLPYNTPISFNTLGSLNTNNSIVMSSNGNMTINVSGGSGTLILNSNVQINGTTNNVFSTITNYLDPILNIGSITGTVPAGDLKDRGIQFYWNNSGTTNQGFFGFKNSIQRFVFYANETNSNEIITGNYGDVQFGKGFFNNLDLNCGTVANISLLTGCASTGLTITGSGVSISTSSLLLNYNSTISFGNTNESISGTSSGNININTLNNISLTTVSGGINLNTNTFGTGYVNISNNTPLYFGSQTSGSYIYQGTTGNLRIVNSTGNIFLTPQTNGQVIIPTNDTLVFGNTQTSISSDGTTLKLNGYNVSINSTGPTVLNGNVFINGTLSATSAIISADNYVYPLGTHNGTGIINITNSTTSGLVNITTTVPNSGLIGQTVVISSTGSLIDGTYAINTVINPNTFTISHGSVLTTSNLGNLKTSLNAISSSGLELDYWQSTGTSPSLSYQTGFLGLQAGNNTLVYYSQASVGNNIVNSGTLGNMTINQLNTNNINGISGAPLNLNSVFNTSTFLVQGSNFQIQGGSIDNTPIGQTTPANGRFSNLTSGSSSNLATATLTSTLNYSVDRITLSSLQPTANPSLSKIITYVNVQGNNFSSSGTIGNLSLVNDGQLKKILCQSCSSGGSYSLVIPNLISCNPLGRAPAKGIRFTRAGMSCELIWNSQGVNSSTGCFEIIGGLAYVF